MKTKLSSELYDKLQSKRKWIKRRSILLALFVMGVNIYAWFIYMSKANLDIKANVLSWDINFFDNNEEVKDIEVDTGGIYPGMNVFEKKINIRNSSEVKANFSFDIDKVNILGNEIVTSDTDQNQLLSSLKMDYPFVINISSSKTELENDDYLNFLIRFNWEYEGNDNLYYKLNSFYKFDESVIYYTYDGSNYIEDSTVNSDNFFNKLNDNLYLEKDDADSFWGTECKKYQTESGKSCVNFHVKLVVTQKE